MTATRLPIRKTYKLYIGGKFPRTESGRTYPVRDKAGDLLANVCLASRKDMRNAVVAARKALGGWSGATPFLRGQILYRLTEMLEDRKAQFVGELVACESLSTARAERQVQDGIDLIVHHAGWTDKFQQIASTVNPVASPHFNFTVPEPVGVAGVVCPEQQGFLGLLNAIVPLIAGGNTVVMLASESSPLSAISLAEAMATSDLPGGVLNILTGKRAEIVPHLKEHMDVNALSIWDATAAEQADIRDLREDNLKRLHFYKSGSKPGPEAILDFQEYKTSWHPVGL